MSCELVQTAAHGYFDGELDAVRAAEFERHLENCAECQASLEGMESLRTRLQETDLCEHASPHLREQLRQQLAPSTKVPRVTAMSLRRWFLIPALLILAVAASSTAWLLLQPHTESARITAELIDAHVHSLQPGHLTDVQSTDQHTVKPWFDGKLDFIPPVSDYSEQGFLLVGGRLDVVGGHNVAALVYSHRKHFVNLFVWPVRNAETVFDSLGSRQGYNWIVWRFGDMRLCLVSDSALPDLRQLKDLIHP